MDTIVYSLVQSQRATDVVVTECELGKTEHTRFQSVFHRRMDTMVYSLVQSQRATDVVVAECELGKTEHAHFQSVFAMCDLTRLNGHVTLCSSVKYRVTTTRSVLFPSSFGEY